jgi:putative ABC transport system permease protein
MPVRDPFEPVIPTRSRDKIAADNRAEIESWIADRAAELAAQGLSPHDARRRAVEEFGDVVSAERYARDQDVAADRRVRVTLWLEEIRSDLRIAARTLARTPTVTAVVLLTFALGIGATTAVFSVVHAMLLRRLPYGDEARLAYLPALDNGVIRPGFGGARHSAAALVALRERTTSFTAIAGVEMANGILRGSDGPEQLWESSVTGEAFDVLQARAAIGRTFRTDEASGSAGDAVVVLLDALWRRRFGADPDIIGRVIDFDNARREVIGVMPPGFRVPTYEQAELLTPLDIERFARDPNRSQVRFVRLFGRVKRGVSFRGAQADLDRAMRMLQAELPRSFGGIETRVVPIRAAVAGNARPRLLVLMGAAVFVLLIALANVAGVLLSRAIARRHELAVRVALGAGRRRLIRQFLAEGVVLAVFGAALGLLVAQVGVVALRQIAETALPEGTTFSLSGEPRVVLFAVVAAVLAALASSLLPALGATRALGIALRRDDRHASPSRGTARMRLGLVAGQIAVSVVLLVGAGLFLQTLHRLAALDLGYSTEHALTFRPRFTQQKSNGEQDVFYASLWAQLRAIPGVLSAGGGNIPTSGQGTVTGLAIEGRPEGETRPPDVRYTPASDDYFAALRIPVLRGRTFTPEDRDSTPWVAVVSAGLAKQLWPDGDPIGARVKVEANKPWATIVGVVGDVRMGGADAPQPTVYTSQRQDHWPGAAWVVLRAEGDPAALAGRVREVVKRVDPTLVIIGLRTLEEFRRSTPAIAERRMLLQLLLAFALVALSVSAIGVYGVSSYATEARRREFGIRIALGSSRRHVLWLALRDAARAAVLGALVGLPLALLLASRLREMLYAVAPFDPLTVAAVLGALFLVVFAAALVPARRAALIDPARTMRTD